MELHQLRCFLAAADELHFGRAAQRLHMLPSALGRHIRLLEEDLATPLFARTTRSVSLTEDGSALVVDARALIAEIEAIERRFREKNRPKTTRRFRIGAMDSAAAGLLPQLMADVHARHPNIAIRVLEEKTVKLLPKVLSGALDLAFVRPPNISTGGSNSGRCSRRARSSPCRRNIASRGADRCRLATLPESR